MSAIQEVLYRLSRLPQVRGPYFPNGAEEPDEPDIVVYEEPMILAMKDAQFQHEMFERIRIYEELEHKFKQNSGPNENR